MTASFWLEVFQEICGALQTREIAGLLFLHLNRFIISLALHKIFVPDIRTLGIMEQVKVMVLLPMLMGLFRLVMECLNLLTMVLHGLHLLVQLSIHHKHLSTISKCFGTLLLMLLIPMKIFMLH